MALQNPINAIADNPNNVFEKAKSAISNAVNNAVQSTAGQDALKVLEKPLSLLSYVAKPYRDYVAPGLSAILMEANSQYREQNKTLNFQQQLNKAFNLSKESVKGEPEWRRAVSPGRALVGLVGDWMPGVQGTDKLDWENPQEVNKYFTSGSAQFWSGLADVGFNLMDPVAAIGTRGYKLAKNALITRSLSTKAGDVGVLHAELQAAAKDPMLNSGAQQIFKIVENNPDDITRISKYGFVAASKVPARLATAISEAYKQGGRPLMADLISASMGHKESVDKFMQMGGSLQQHLLENSNKTTKINNCLLYTSDAADED